MKHFILYLDGPWEGEMTIANLDQTDPPDHVIVPQEGYIYAKHIADKMVVGGEDCWLASYKFTAHGPRSCNLN